MRAIGNRRYAWYDLCPMASRDRGAHLYLSPHLDDVVFSCGGRIWQQGQASESVVVVTVFAGAPDPTASFSPYARELHERWGHPVEAVKERQREDRQALALLGAEAVHWDYRDCIYRRTPRGDYAYASEAALWGEMHPSEAALAQRLTGRIRDLPLRPEGALYVPLAVGGHVDHRIVRRAAEMCGRELIYYEDFPYAEDPEDVSAALAGRRWKSELVSLPPEALEAKIAAIARYRSQISTFWDGEEGVAASVRAFAQQIGAGRPAERYWHPL